MESLASLGLGEFSVSGVAGKRKRRGGLAVTRGRLKSAAVRSYRRMLYRSEGREVSSGLEKRTLWGPDQAGRLRIPAAPDSRPNSSLAPEASHASALTRPPPGSRARISALSARRTSRIRPSE